MNNKQKELVKALELLTATMQSKDKTPEREMVMREMTIMIMEAQKGIITHFSGFVRQNKLDKQFKEYCAKNPVRMKIMPEKCKCEVCDEEGEVIGEIDKEELDVVGDKVDTRYIG